MAESEPDPLRWFKYREKYAEGPGNWEYEYTCMALLEEKIWDLKQQAHWNEYYRGVEFEEIEKPPLEWLINKSKSLDEKIASLYDDLNEIKKLIETY